VGPAVSSASPAGLRKKSASSRVSTPTSTTPLAKAKKHPRGDGKIFKGLSLFLFFLRDLPLPDKIWLSRGKLEKLLQFPIRSCRIMA
jgi:hypothetical protein